MIPRWCGAVTTLGIFLLGSKPASKFQPEAERTLALLMAVGELHGRNLASALMRSCVHNRTRDRGGKPIRLAWPWAFPPVLPKDRGRSLQKIELRYRSELPSVLVGVAGAQIVAKEIDVEAVLEHCRALIEQIDAALSAEEPLLLDVSALAELLSHLESAASALRKATRRGRDDAAGPQRWR